MTDKHQLSRFLRAQSDSYDRALAELRQGQKRSHWMWYIFPQYAGLGLSATSRKYAIRNVAEAKAYLNHPVLGPRLTESTSVVLSTEGRTAHQIFGSPDDMKLRSCATLFAFVTPPDSVFHKLLEKFFRGDHDERTLELIQATE